MLQIRKTIIDNIAQFYVEVFNEKHVPHIYAVCVLAVFDYINFFSVCIYWDVKLSKPIIVVVILAMVLANYLIYKLISPSSLNNRILNWSYFVATILVLIAVIKFS